MEQDNGAEEQADTAPHHPAAPFPSSRSAPGSATSRTVMDTKALLAQRHFLPPLPKKK